MTIKSLLIGSAAAVVAASSAQAADAIVAADPEPVEYVQVCDAFGSGYFYIPGTETCLKIGGYVRAESTTTWTNGTNAASTTLGHDVRITIDANSQTEIGAVKAHVRLDEDSSRFAASTNGGAATTGIRFLSVDRAHITIGDSNYVNVGYNGSIYDFSPVGEQSFNTGAAAGNQVQYAAAFDSAKIWIQAVAATNTSPIAGHVAGRADFTFGDFGVKLAAGYDGTGASNARWGARVNLSYMGFGARYDWSQNGNGNAFGNGYTNVFGVSWGGDVTDKLNLAVAADFADARGGVAAQDAFAISAMATYTIVTGLVADARIIYTDFNAANTAANPTSLDNTAVRLRLTRSF